MNEVNEVERIVMRQRAYIKAIKPYTDMKVEIYCKTIPTMIMHPDGRVEHRYNFTEQQKEALSNIDALIDAVKSKFVGV